MRKRREFCKWCGNKNDSNRLSYCNACFNAYMRKKYSENRENEIKRCSEWNKRNPDVVARNMRRCRNKNPEHYREYAKNYVQANKDKYRIYDHNKRVKRRAQINGNKLTLADWKLIKENFNNICFYCKSSNKKLTIDHYIPLSRGGEHIISNIVPACSLCNSRKTNKMPDDFIKQLEAECQK